ncbi:cytidine deaminase [Compostibacter hankyongensis]|uniref:Cytidine deaminase n=1 Tax=Compostibacter hankyongensis TaxID=1007089 RepID=A0ABP8G2P2_9BACT
MEQVRHSFEYTTYPDIAALPEADRMLLLQAQQAIAQAYAPYSRFRVGAAVLLSNGEVVTGANQENAASPAGLCAERVALAAVSASYPGTAVDTLAISYDPEAGKSDHPVSPCGICRQTLLEYEGRLQHPIRVVMGGKTGPVWVIPSASLLLPFAFSAAMLG